MQGRILTEGTVSMMGKAQRPRRPLLRKMLKITKQWWRWGSPRHVINLQEFKVGSWFCIGGGMCKDDREKSNSIPPL